MADGKPLNYVHHVKITTMAGEWGIIEIDRLRKLSRKDMRLMYDSNKS